MDSGRFRWWLDRVVACPAEEVLARSSCRTVADQRWTTLLGWGNWNAKVVFVGANPLWKPESAATHAAQGSIAASDHAYRLSLDGFEGEPHFRYHRKILRNLRDRDERLKEQLPEELEYFAFFTEMAFCPSRFTASLPPDVPGRCFGKNVLPFMHEGGFSVVVALGREASELCVRTLIGPREAEQLDGPFHGLLFRATGGRPSVVTSYHPNFPGTWARTAVADRLFELFDRHGVELA